MPGPTKVCTKCKTEKLRSEFASDRRTADGLAYACRECKKAADRELYLASEQRRNDNHARTGAQWRALRDLRKAHPREYARLYRAHLRSGE